jgi:hypothetical protein
MTMVLLLLLLLLLQHKPRKALLTHFCPLL